MGTEIRAATRADVEGVRRVAERAWHDAHEPIIGAEAVEEFLDEFYEREDFERRVDRDDVLHVVAAESGEVVGFATARPVEEDGEGTFALGQLYVAPDRYGEGVGTDLLEYVEAAARDRGGEQIQLSVMSGNERAVGFYESRGYEQVEEFRDERVGTDSSKYVKPLL